MRTVLLLNNDQLGHGDRELSQKILGTFLRKATAFKDLDAILFYNSGVKLCAADSPVIVELTLLAEAGVDLLPCGTCVEHYGVDVKAGRISDMDTIIREMDRAEKAITL